MNSMFAHGATPILNVSGLAESFRWFERLGWKAGGAGTPTSRTNLGRVKSDRAAQQPGAAGSNRRKGKR
jgi:hypothetical protein